MNNLKSFSMNIVKRINYSLLISSLLFSPLILADTTLSSAIKSENNFSQEEIQTAVIKVTVMLNVAKAINKTTDKIKSCDKRKRPFKLNNEDKKYLKKYQATFSTSLLLINLLNGGLCTYSEEIQLEKEYKKTYKSLKLLSIFPEVRKSLKVLSNTEYRKTLEDKGYNQLSKVPVDLLFYLKKRVGNELYDSSLLFTLMDNIDKKGMGSMN